MKLKNQFRIENRVKSDAPKVRVVRFKVAAPKVAKPKAPRVVKPKAAAVSKPRAPPKPKASKPKPRMSLADLRVWAKSQRLPSRLTHQELIHAYMFMYHGAEADGLVF